MLNEYEKNRYNVISDLVSKKITIREAVQLLNITERQVYRLKKIFKEQGEKGFIHGNCGKENPNKKDEKLIEELEHLYLIDHYDFNFAHFYEEHIFGNYDISYDTMLKAFTRDDIISPLAHKKQYKNIKIK